MSAFPCVACRGLAHLSHERDCAQHPARIRATALLDVADIADAEAWRHAWVYVHEAEETCRGAATALGDLAQVLRLHAAIVLEGGGR